jgi:hypothetical protein
MRATILIFAIAATVCGAATARAISFLAGHCRGTLYSTSNGYLPSWDFTSATAPSASYALPPTTYLMEDGSTIGASAHTSYVTTYGYAEASASSHLSVGGATPCSVTFQVEAETDWDATIGTMMYNWCWGSRIQGYAAPGDIVELTLGGGAYSGGRDYLAFPWNYYQVTGGGAFSIAPWYTYDTPHAYYRYYGFRGYDLVSMTITITHQGSGLSSWVNFCGDPVGAAPTSETGTITWKGGTIADPTNWNVAANWNPDTAVPNGPGAQVNLGNQPAANNVVDMLSQGQTVGTLVFSANTSTTIQSSGGFVLTLDDLGRVSIISVAGNHTISAPVTLNNDATIVGTGALNVSGGISGPHNLDVYMDLTAKSIEVDTLTVDPGLTVTIEPIPGGPLASSDNLRRVPEPCTLVLLGVCLVSLFACDWWRRK